MRHSELVMLWSTKSVWSLQYGPNHLLTPLFISVYKCRMISIIHQFGAPIHGWKLSNIFIIMLPLVIKKNNHWINYTNNQRWIKNTNKVNRYSIFFVLSKVVNGSLSSTMRSQAAFPRIDVDGPSWISRTSSVLRKMLIHLNFVSLEIEQE